MSDLKFFALLAVIVGFALQGQYRASLVAGVAAIVLQFVWPARGQVGPIARCLLFFWGK